MTFSEMLSDHERKSLSAYIHFVNANATEPSSEELNDWIYIWMDVHNLPVFTAQEINDKLKVMTINKKPFSLTIEWDRITSGEFPEKKFMEANSKFNILIENVNSLKSKVTFTTELENSDDELEVALELGQFVNSIVMTKQL